jgi:Sec-independent protein translocase protein TatA
MFQNIGLTEILIVSFLLILFLGAKRLPIFGKGLGEAKSELKKSYRESGTATKTNSKKS